VLCALALTALLVLPPAASQAAPDSSWASRAWSLASAVLDDEARYYLRIGGITPGAGVSLGPGVRLKDLAGGRVDFDAFASVSHRKYLYTEATATTPVPGISGLRVGPFVRRKYFPEEDYFGTGVDSRLEDRVNYAYDETAGGAVAFFKPRRELVTEARIEYRHPDVGRGHDDSFPSLQDVNGFSHLPGLQRQPDFLVATASVTYEDAEPAAHPRRGSRYEASLSRYWGRGSSASDFLRFDVDAREYLPIVPDRHLVVLRGVASLTGSPAGATTPFYYLPRLGGGRSLRGFRELRFHDRNTMLVQAEYRWLPWPFVETAAFVESGAVAPRLSTLNRHEILSDCGLAVRFGTDARVFFRVETVFGSKDGTRVFVKFSGAF
jgi:hypothetical protein